MCIGNMLTPTLKPQRGDMCVVLDVEYGNSTYRLSSNLRYDNLNCQLSEKEACLVK